MPHKALEREIRARNEAFDEDGDSEIHWDDVIAGYKATRDWELTAAATGISLKELSQRFLKTCPLRPKHVKTLKDWAVMLEAQAKIEHIQALQKIADMGGRQVPTQIEEERRRSFDPVSLLPKCCPAAEMFRGGWTVLDAETLLGDLPCPKDCSPELCRRKCMLAEKVMIRQAQSSRAKEGHVEMTKYLGDVVLHQNTGGQEAFAPAKIVFKKQDQ